MENSSLDAGTKAAPRLLFDVTGVVHWYAYFKHPSGIQRVSEKLISSTSLQHNPKVEFVARMLGSDTFYTIDRKLLADLSSPERRRMAIARLRALFTQSMRLAPLGRLLADARYYHIPYILFAMLRLDPVIEWIFSGRWPKCVTPLAAAQSPGPDDVIFNSGDLWWQKQYVSVLLALKARTGARIVQMIHDLFVIERPEWFQPGFSRLFKGEFETLAPHVDRWLTNSQFVAGQLTRYLEGRELTVRPAAVLPMGWDSFAHLTEGGEREEDDVLLRYGLAKRPFILFVGTVEPRKNLGALLDALGCLRAELDAVVPDLVVVGGRGWRSGAVRSRLRKDTNVHWFRAVPDADLAMLYRAARFTIAPSFTEGWGLPVQESIAYGVPCISSSGGALPEAGAGLSVLFDPADTQSLKMAMIPWITNDEALAEARATIASALSRMRRVTWNDAANVLLHHALD